MLLALLLPGCYAAPALRPLPAEGVELIDRDAAAAAFEGVTVVAATDRWRFHPREVRQAYTPIHVTLYNRAEFGIEVNIDDLTLTDDEQRVFAAVPPEELLYRDYHSAGPGSEPLPVLAADAPCAEARLHVVAARDHRLLADSKRHSKKRRRRRGPRVQVGIGFHLPLLVGCDPVWGCGALHPYWWYHPHGAEVVDPAMREAVVDLALEEGVLLPGKKTQGFVYFDHLGPTREIDLCWDLWAEHDERPRKTLCLAFERR